MAMLTNSDQTSEHGIGQGPLASYLTHIIAALLALSKKLDASDSDLSDYEADMQQIIVSGAAPLLDKITVTEIIAEYDA